MTKPQEEAAGVHNGPTDQEKRIEKGFDFAADTTKQVLTLSTGVLALTLTFAKDLLNDLPEGLAWWLAICLGIGWLLYLLSISCGILTLMFLTASVGPQSPGTGSRDTPWSSHIAVPALVQILSFFFGTAFVAAFGLFVFGYLYIY